ncbi:MAG: FixH family protein [Tagaea sp.]
MNIAKLDPNRHLWLVYPVAFIAVLIANGALVYFALSSWPGLAYDNAFERGRKYNQVLREEHCESKLGWRIETAFEADGARAGDLVVRAADRDGRPLVDLDLMAVLVRPVGGTVPDRPVDLRAQAPGVYAARVDVPMAGQWEVRLTAIDPAGDRAHEAHRFVVR